MKERPNLNELAKEIHNDNKLKGFHDVDWSDEHCLMLAICELCEAIEADRKGKRTKWDAYNQDLNWFCDWSRDSVGYKEKEIHAFAVYIKDSIEDELADFVIRLLDLAGKKKQEVTLYDNKVTDEFKDLMNESNSLNERIYYIIREVMRPSKYVYPSTIGIVNYSISCVEYLCNDMNIDLWLHVDLKLKYNKTRPYKHGKEY